jgi:hypothetical protein
MYVRNNLDKHTTMGPWASEQDNQNGTMRLDPVEQLYM